MPVVKLESPNPAPEDAVIRSHLSGFIHCPSVDDILTCCDLLRGTTRHPWGKCPRRAAVRSGATIVASVGDAFRSIRATSHVPVGLASGQLLSFIGMA